MGAPVLLRALALAACLANASAGCADYTTLRRSSWGAREPTEETRLPRSPLPYVAVHHANTSSCSDRESCKQRVRSYQNHHMDRNGWADIGYNFLISEEGDVFEGRGWDLQGAHVSGYNEVSLGVCFIGDYTNQLPPAAALSAFDNLLECGVERGRLARAHQLFGHLQAAGASTLCPGAALLQWVEQQPRWVRIPEPQPAPAPRRRPQRIANCPMFVPRIQWGARDPSGPLTPFTMEAKTLVIVHQGVDHRGGLHNCTTTTRCIELVRYIQEKHMEHGHVDIPFNFLIGEDGRVFVGRGWNKQGWYPTDHKKTAISVAFIGQFRYRKPNYRALSVFEQLMECGVGKGKLSPEYSILGDRQLEINTDCPGDGLYNWLKTLLHWSPSRFPATVTCPEIVPRSEWGAREPRERNPLNESLEFLAVHHGESADCSGRQSCAERLRSYQNHHMDARGWADIGYNFLISEDGEVYEGRGWDLQGAHIKGYNSLSLGVCFIGNYSDHLPSEAALNALKALAKCGVDRGRLSGSYFLQAHKDLAPTDCPGRALYEWIKDQPRWRHLPELERAPVPHWRPNRTEGCPPVRRRQEYGAREQMNVRWTFAPEPLHLVMVSKNWKGPCGSEAECDQALRGNYHSCNFVVTGSGSVYEDSGWDRIPQIFFTSPRGRNVANTLHVCFTSDHASSEPSPAEVTAFESLVSCGVNNSRIRPDYGLVFQRAVAGAADCPGGEAPGLCAWAVARPHWTTDIPADMPDSVRLYLPCVNPEEA